VKQIKSLQAARCHYARSISLSLHQKHLPVESLASLATLLAGNRQRAAAVTNSEVTAPGRTHSPHARQSAPMEEVPCNVIVKYEGAEVKGNLVLGRDWRVYPD